MLNFSSNSPSLTIIVQKPDGRVAICNIVKSFNSLIIFTVAKNRLIPS